MNFYCWTYQVVLRVCEQTPTSSILICERMAPRSAIRVRSRIKRGLYDAQEPWQLLWERALSAWQGLLGRGRRLS